MAAPHVVTGLLAKRRQLAREVDAAERYLNRLQANLAHVDAVLRLYTDPHGGVEPGAILYGLVPRRAPAGSGAVSCPGAPWTRYAGRAHRA